MCGDVNWKMLTYTDKLNVFMHYSISAGKRKTVTIV